MNENIKNLFGNWEESIIWSCLQGVMGEIHTNAAEDAAMAILGDFVFCAGKPDEKLLVDRKKCLRQFMIVVPQNEEWAALIERYYEDMAKKVLRYAFKKEKDAFDVRQLQQAVRELPKGYELKPLG